MTKSMLQEVNLDVEIGRGCNISVGKDKESLVFLQISYATMNLLMELCSFGHQTRVNKD